MPAGMYVLYHTSLGNYASFSLQVPSILSILLGYTQCQYMKHGGGWGGGGLQSSNSQILGRVSCTGNLFESLALEIAITVIALQK
jgi:hypothetical protein